jgi:anti-anti-sigma factor
MVNYTVEKRGANSVRIALHGELAGRVWTERIRAGLEEHYVDDGVRSIEVDVSGVTFMDNFGVATLMALQRESAGNGKRFTVRSAQGQVREKLHVTGVIRVLQEGR